jgi:flagellar assembly protein FliH
MSSSPEPTEIILRGVRAKDAITAHFAVDFRMGAQVPVPSELVERARAAAQAAGYAEGWAQGQREAGAVAQAAVDRTRAAERDFDSARAAELARAVGAITAAADVLADRAVPLVAELAETVLRSAVDLAEALLARELATVSEPGLDALRRVMAVAPEKGTVSVRLHPADLATLGVPAGGEREYPVNGRLVTLCPDPSLSPGDAIAEQGTTSIDGRLAEALRRIRQELDR